MSLKRTLGRFAAAHPVFTIIRVLNGIETPTRRPGTSILCLLLCASLLGPHGSVRGEGGFERGMRAYHKGDFEAARDLWQPLAEQSDVRAQYWLAHLYAAGNGVPQDDAEASRWFALAAEQGLPAAQFSLAYRYHHGLGVEPSIEQTERWYRNAADQDYARAQYNLANLYEQGEDGTRDLVQAYKWFALAGRQRFEDARRRKKRVARELDDYQIAEAELLVKDWKQRRKRALKQAGTDR